MGRLLGLGLCVKGLDVGFCFRVLGSWFRVLGLGFLFRVLRWVLDKGFLSWL